ncbi:hypothetical protein SAMN05216533_2447 [Streptomyces sp. Ag109_O5-10]|nr:hypothetical protein SAMN05216533_2447 [Streptomyces sp. Ag109_O5-10]
MTPPASPGARRRTPRRPARPRRRRPERLCGIGQLPRQHRVPHRPAVGRRRHRHHADLPSATPTAGRTTGHCRPPSASSRRQHPEVLELLVMGSRQRQRRGRPRHRLTDGPSGVAPGRWARADGSMCTRPLSSKIDLMPASPCARSATSRFACSRTNPRTRPRSRLRPARAGPADRVGRRRPGRRRPPWSGRWPPDPRCPCASASLVPGLHRDSPGATACAGCAAGYRYATARSTARRCSALAHTSSTGPFSLGSAVRMVSCSRTYQPS